MHKYFAKTASNTETQYTTEDALASLGDMTQIEKMPFLLHQPGSQDKHNPCYIAGIFEWIFVVNFAIEIQL